MAEPAKSNTDVEEIDLSQEPEPEVEAEPWMGVKPTRQYDPERVREDMRGRIALILMAILAGVVLASFITVWINGGLTEPIKDLLTLIFGPVITLVGAATGYYYGGRSQAAADSEGNLNR